jgi:hypothetical protein
MAVAKAQYAISEITTMLRSKGVNVRVSLGLDEICFQGLKGVPSLLSILLLVVCLDSATFFWQKPPCHTIVRLILNNALLINSTYHI